jgi:GGDEF domain-containing protein
MGHEPPSGEDPHPLTRDEIERWIRRLPIAADLQTSLVSAIDGLLHQQEHHWRASQQDSLRAVESAFAERLARTESELSAREHAIRAISHHFEQVIVELTEKARLDSKTKLMNFAHFTERLEAFLALEQRGPWCVVGMADINNFKGYNDTLGHSVGDLIIERIAQLLRERIRSQDLLGRQASDSAGDLHGRFGGDEFCFMLSDLHDWSQGSAISERFRDAVGRYRWETVDPRLADAPIHVDVGIVCFKLGQIAERKAVAPDLAARLMRKADELMYMAKSGRTHEIPCAKLQLDSGELVAIPDSDFDAASPAPDRDSGPARYSA